MIGLVFHDVFVGDDGRRVRHASSRRSASASTQTIVKWGIAALLILPQSVLLGVTFPLMSAGVMRREPRARRARARAALLREQPRRGGAACSSPGSGCSRPSGCPGTLLAAAMINVVVAARSRRARAVARRRAADAPLAPAHGTDGAPRGAAPRLDARARCCSPSASAPRSRSFIYEIGWIRMLVARARQRDALVRAHAVGVHPRPGARRVVDPPPRRRERAIRSRMLGSVQMAMGIARDRDAAGLHRVVRLDGALIGGVRRERRTATSLFIARAATRSASPSCCRRRSAPA